MSIVKTIFSVILTIAVVGVASFVGYVAYSIYLDIKKTTEAKMKKNNVTWTKDGMKVGVKEVSAEKQIDKTQKYVFCDFPSILGGFAMICSPLLPLLQCTCQPAESQGCRRVGGGGVEESLSRGQLQCVSATFKVSRARPRRCG